LNECGDPNYCEERTGGNNSGTTLTVQEAANGSSFTLSSPDPKTIRIAISSAPSYRMKMCGLVGNYSELENKKMEIFADGKSVGTDSANSNSFDLTYPNTITTAKRISVKICGYAIGGGEKTYSPPPR
jgi:hypothetical protein